MCKVSGRLLGLALAASLSAAVLPKEASAESTFVVSIPPAACPHPATAEQCWTSLRVDLTGVTKFNFSVRASGYDINDIADAEVFLETLSYQSNTWSCLGTLPCRVARVRNLPPDAFGNQQHIYESPTIINLPVSQRKPTQIRLVSKNDKAVSATQVSAQFFRQ